jgi:hypothetical protein
VSSPSALTSTRRLALPAGLALGAAIGVGTSFAQADLSGPWASLANAASPWLLGAFVAGALSRSRSSAVTAGLLACLAEVIGYYLATALRGFAVADSEIAFWTACALIGGPLFGWAGWAWRRAPNRLRPVGAAFLPSVFLAEAVGTYAIRLHYAGDAILFAAIGGLLLVAISRGGRLRPVLAWTVLLVAFGVLIFGPILQATSGIAFGA